MRLDEALARRKLTQSRSQAANLIKLGKVFVDGKPAKKPAMNVGHDTDIRLQSGDKYVSRAALKLKSVSERLKLNFKDATVLDVGSSTGGFTQYALQQGASKVIAVDVGTNQLHPSLRTDRRIELHEKTDIRELPGPLPEVTMVVMDVSFISLRDVLPSVKKLTTNPEVTIIAMLKPQFEAGNETRHKGVIKNSAMRRDILRDFEAWARKSFVVLNKADSEVSGAKGNTERFYVLKPTV